MQKQKLIVDGKFDASTFPEAATAAITLYMSDPKKSPQFAGFDGPKLLATLTVASAVSQLSDGSPEGLKTAFELVSAEEGVDSTIVSALQDNDYFGYKSLSQVVIPAVSNKLTVLNGLEHFFGLDSETSVLKLKEIDAAKQRSTAAGHIDALLDDPTNETALAYFASIQLKPIQVVAGIAVEAETVPANPEPAPENATPEPVVAEQPTTAEIVAQVAREEGIVPSNRDVAVAVGVLNLSRMMAQNQAATGEILEGLGTSLTKLGAQLKEQSKAFLDSVAELETALTEKPLEIPAA